MELCSENNFFKFKIKSLTVYNYNITYISFISHNNKIFFLKNQKMIKIKNYINGAK